MSFENENEFEMNESKMVEEERSSNGEGLQPLTSKEDMSVWSSEKNRSAKGAANAILGYLTLTESAAGDKLPEKPETVTSKPNDKSGSSDKIVNLLSKGASDKPEFKQELTKLLDDARSQGGIPGEKKAIENLNKMLEKSNVGIELRWVPSPNRSMDARTVEIYSVQAAHTKPSRVIDMMLPKKR